MTGDFNGQPQTARRSLAPKENLYHTWQILLEGETVVGRVYGSMLG